MSLLGASAAWPSDATKHDSERNRAKRIETARMSGSQQVMTAILKVRKSRRVECVRITQSSCDCKWWITRLLRIRFLSGIRLDLPNELLVDFAEPLERHGDELAVGLLELNFP